MTITCPVPLEEKQIITLAHGSGGKQTHRLLEEVFLPAFKNEHLDLLHDGAFLDLPTSQIVFTTDSFVVQPLFFPGGDIGKLAVTGTANDLAMCGAKPRYLSAGFILEEGISIEELKRIVSSMEREAKLQSIEIVAGDTKVIERQTGKNLFINTSGIGTRMTNNPIGPLQIEEGDAILLSGDIGRHGIAVMAMRENFEFSTPLESDCAPLFPLVEALLKEAILVHAMRDLTRGGLATALVEMAESAQRNFLIEEEAISVSEGVESACEILGFDPHYVANEGRFIAFVSQDQAALALQILQKFPDGENARLIGRAESKSGRAQAIIKNPFGTKRPLYRLVGDQLPRIC